MLQPIVISTVSTKPWIMLELLIGLGCDGTNVNIGSRSGVTVFWCLAHHLENSLKSAHFQDIDELLSRTDGSDCCRREEQKKRRKLASSSLWN